jgi:hypothetical protein
MKMKTPKDKAILRIGLKKDDETQILFHIENEKENVLAWISFDIERAETVSEILIKYITMAKNKQREKETWQKITDQR